jgi:DNA-binding MarR family transcriptional regulator
MRPPTRREYQVLAALIHLECGERPLTVGALAAEARLDVKDAERAVTALVAKGFLDMGAVPPVEMPDTSPR